MFLKFILMRQHDNEHTFCILYWAHSSLFLNIDRQPRVLKSFRFPLLLSWILITGCTQGFHFFPSWNEAQSLLPFPVILISNDTGSTAYSGFCHLTAEWRGVSFYYQEGARLKGEVLLETSDFCMRQGANCVWSHLCICCHLAATVKEI